MPWIELSEGVNLDYLEKRKLGDILGFKFRNKVKHYKICRIDKKRNKYWAKPVKLYKTSEIDMDKLREAIV